MRFRNPFSAFDRFCQQQKVQLDPGIVEAGQRQRSSLVWSNDPNGLYAAVAEAGSMLRKYPDVPLASKPIALKDKEPRLVRHSLAARSLIDIINASLEQRPSQNWDTTFRCLGAQALEVCAEAEKGFSHVIAQMRTPDKPIAGYSHRLRYQLITGQDDRPIAVRKRSGVNSALSLTDITINGIPYPAGSLMRINLLSEYQVMSDGAIRYEPEVEATSPKCVGAEQVSHAAFMRLSAFAESPVKRGRDFRGLWLYTQFNSELRKTLHLTMPEIADVAHGAIQHAKSQVA